MLVRGVSRLAAVVGLLILTTVFLLFHSKIQFFLHSHGSQKIHSLLDKSWNETVSDLSQTHVEVFSHSTKHGGYFNIDFGGEQAMNPSIIPHPTSTDTWIVVAQLLKSSGSDSTWNAELVCDAKFKKGKLACVKPPTILPIAATTGGNCEGDMAYLDLNIGPHDARVFYGPRGPLTIYGSNSGYTCFGQWIQAFSMLVDWGPEAHTSGKNFRVQTELQRPAPFRTMEKNYFLFWNKDGEMYVHYDVSPRRVFAKLNGDGTVGPDIAQLAAINDEECMARYMPTIAPALESVHQATNSLSITLCNRSDPSCEPDDSNTYILTIFQHKSFYSFHSVYEPYVMLFKRAEPFDIYGISSKPIWIHGRGRAGQARRPPGLEFQRLEHWNQTEMVYVTSISWKAHGKKYHGYLDDVLFIGFGIEDERTAAIDVVAGDLIESLGLCSTI